MIKKTFIKKDYQETPVECTYLGQDFYSSIRKEVTEKRLDFLKEASQNIPLPSLFGEFSSDDHYLKTVDLYIKATEETRNRGVFFLKNILPSLQNYNTLLDIGPGNGKLTRWVGRKFKEITLVDPVLQVLDTIPFSFFPKKSLLKKVNLSFLEAPFPGDYFDLIILSHVIYHFPREKWIEVVQKAIGHLKPGGIIAIVINSGLGRDELRYKFKGTSCSLQ